MTGAADSRLAERDAAGRPAKRIVYAPDPQAGNWGPARISQMRCSSLGKMRLSPIAKALDEQRRGVEPVPAERRVRRPSTSPRQPRLFR